MGCGEAIARHGGKFALTRLRTRGLTMRAIRETNNDRETKGKDDSWHLVSVEGGLAPSSPKHQKDSDP